ncbi:leucine-rich repeat-containing protein kinase family protein [Paraglaciecola sp.]|uniref:leucine-rich repeat-containing protein kinase family protein n=1 Tax=Paraglaciecola sp. TaxID=1920173 RepID=UPI003EF1E22B
MHTLAQLKSGALLGVTKLSLSENLSEFPMEILTLADSLEILDLSNNQLNTLPKELKQLTQLKIIFASNNHFEVLPSVLGECENLEMIGFKTNQIKQVPAESLPKNLRWLILTDNNIETLPESLGHRPRLQKLALAGNQLTRLPQSMANLVNLELVRISANQLTECPTQLLDLPKLAWFAFAGNPFCKNEQHIDSVPAVPSASFTLQEQLGQGASGVISKATWIENPLALPSEVAVKMFKGSITSDGYPEDELNACLQAGNHNSLVKNLAQVNEEDCLALIMALIPSHFRNLGLPPNFDTCTRDTFPQGFVLTKQQVTHIVQQMQDVFEHLHNNHVCHGDLYAHNTLFDQDANIIFGDFGAASMYQMLTTDQQAKIKQIEQRALDYFVEDLKSICVN